MKDNLKIKPGHRTIRYERSKIVIPLWVGGENSSSADTWQEVTKLMLVQMF